MGAIPRRPWRLGGLWRLSIRHGEHFGSGSTTAAFDGRGDRNTHETRFRAGGASGNANGSWRTGEHTHEANRMRRGFAELVRKAQDLIGRLNRGRVDTLPDWLS